MMACPKVEAPRAHGYADDVAPSVTFDRNRIRSARGGVAQPVDLTEFHRRLDLKH
jgi:hypothetical protein